MSSLLVAPPMFWYFNLHFNSDRKRYNWYLWTQAMQSRKGTVDFDYDSNMTAWAVIRNWMMMNDRSMALMHWPWPWALEVVNVSCINHLLGSFSCTVDQSTYATTSHSLHRRQRDGVENLTDDRYCKAIFTNVGQEFGYAPRLPIPMQVDKFYKYLWQLERINIWLRTWMARQTRLRFRNHI